jgi:peptidoglycan/xylan/chitin deacetylase (PgdA/CDA1 family)
MVDAVAHALDYDFGAYLCDNEPYLTSEQVHKLIHMGFTIGAHSVDHPRYSTIGLEEQVDQTLTSIRFLRQRFALGYGAFAFPNGDDNLSPDFFDRIFASGDVAVSFGSIGVLRNIHPHHFGSRLPMEKTAATAEKVIARYYAKSLYDLLIGRRRRAKVGFARSS